MRFNPKARLPWTFALDLSDLIDLSDLMESGFLSHRFPGITAALIRYRHVVHPLSSFFPHPSSQVQEARLFRLPGVFQKGSHQKVSLVRNPHVGGSAPENKYTIFVLRKQIGILFILFSS